MTDKTTLLFDFDGTLVDSLQVIKEIANELAPRYGFEKIHDEDIEALRDKGARELLKTFKISPLKIPFMARDLKRAFREKLNTVPLVPHIKETLEALQSEGYVLGILTSNSHKNVESYLNMHSITSISFICGDVGIFGKPASITKTLKSHNIPKENVLYVGDEVRDIEAAKKVGIKIISVTWGFNSELALKKANPDYLVNKPRDILSILSRP